MQRALPCLAVFCLALLACGGNDPAPNAPGASTSASSEPAAGSSDGTPPSNEPLPPVTAVGDRCNVSKDCKPLGGHHRCMRTSGGSKCYPVPMKSCDEPSCECFNNDPCAANEIGTCAGFENGVVVCK